MEIASPMVDVSPNLTVAMYFAFQPGFRSRARTW
ncbi:hypothetical protein STENM327S_00220 [Streptomyces tendae]